MYCMSSTKVAVFKNRSEKVKNLFFHKVSSWPRSKARQLQSVDIFLFFFMLDALANVTQ